RRVLFRSSCVRLLKGCAMVCVSSDGGDNAASPLVAGFSAALCVSGVLAGGVGNCRPRSWLTLCSNCSRAPFRSWVIGISEVVTVGGATLVAGSTEFTVAKDVAGVDAPAMSLDETAEGSVEILVGFVVAARLLASFCSN